VAAVLASQRPDLVRRLIVAEPNLDPWDGDTSVEIARQTEAEFLAAGYHALVHEAEPDYAATLRFADPLALYRSAVGLAEMPSPTVRELLVGLDIPRTLVLGERSAEPDDLGALREAGIEVAVIRHAGHVMMLDDPRAFARALA
jgi:pimeloyl-ACP methyl ester carboxylesterase